MSAEVRGELARQGFKDEGGRVHVERMLNMRFEGTDTSLMVLPDARDGEEGEEDFEKAFRRVYKSEFGFLLEGKNIVVDDIKVCSLFSELLGFSSQRSCRFAVLAKHTTLWVTPFILR